MSNNKSIPSDSPGNLIRSTSILSAGTLASRVLGFIRDILLAKILGTGFGADAFLVAFKIPNIFRDMVAEGAANSAVVPMFSEYLHTKEREEFWDFVNIVFVWAMIGLSGLTVIGILGAPLIVRMIAPGFTSDTEKLLLTVRLTKIMFPYLVFIGLTAYAVAVLYTFRSFFVPAFSPCLLNVSIIASAYFSSRYMEEPVFGLACGVLIGGILQLIIQIRPLRKTGFRFRRTATLYHPGVVRIVKLLIPRMIGSGIYQLTVLIDVFCASLASIVGAGGIPAIYFANRIIYLPMGLFGVAMASAALPSLSSMASRNETGKMKETIMFSLENIFFIMCPTTVVLLLLSEPIIRVLFERGKFAAYSTHITSSALLFYALGLFSFGGVKILVAGFHAMQDTKTPVKVAALCLSINAALNYLLMFPLKIGGIALASSVAGLVDFLILLFCLDRKLGNMKREAGSYLLKLLSACVIMGAGLYLAWNRINISNEFVKLAACGTGSYLLYGTVCYFLNVGQARRVWVWIKNLKRAA